MAHVMKYTKASCGHMFAHFDRRAEHISNENLDSTRTHLNYNLATHQQMDQGEFVRQRCSEVRCQNRKDVNVMATWVVTAPKDLPEPEHKAFFQASYRFLSDRYGADNVVSAYVHMDEVTPHMHFAFVPVVEDKKRGGYKVSAKEAVSRFDLQRFHLDLQRHVERALGHEVSILNEATRAGNKTVTELKREQELAKQAELAQHTQERTLDAQKQLRDISIKLQYARQELQDCAERLPEARQRLQEAEDRIKPLRGEYEAYRAILRDTDSMALYPPEAKKVLKGLPGKRQEYVEVPKALWEQRWVEASARAGAVRAIEQVDRALQDLKSTDLGRELGELGLHCLQLEQNNRQLAQQVEAHKAAAQQAESARISAIDRVRNTLYQLPKDVAQQFINAWNGLDKPAPERVHHHDRDDDMER